MRKIHLSLFIALLATAYSIDSFAGFSVIPDLSSAPEGTDVTLTLSIDVNSWSFTGGEGICGSSFDYEFTMMLDPSGTASWSNNHFGGDVNLDVNGDPRDLSETVTACANAGGRSLSNRQLSFNLHPDTVSDEVTEVATLDFFAECENGISITAQASQAIAGKSRDVRARAPVIGISAQASQAIAGKSGDVRVRSMSP